MTIIIYKILQIIGFIITALLISLMGVGAVIINIFDRKKRT